MVVARREGAVPGCTGSVAAAPLRLLLALHTGMTLKAVAVFLGQPSGLRAIRAGHRLLTSARSLRPQERSCNSPLELRVSAAASDHGPRLHQRTLGSRVGRPWAWLALSDGCCALTAVVPGPLPVATVASCPGRLEPASAQHSGSTGARGSLARAGLSRLARACMVAPARLRPAAPSRAASSARRLPA